MSVLSIYRCACPSPATGAPSRCSGANVKLVVVAYTSQPPIESGVISKPIVGGSVSAETSNVFIAIPAGIWVAGITGVPIVYDIREALSC